MKASEVRRRIRRRKKRRRVQRLRRTNSGRWPKIIKSIAPKLLRNLVWVHNRMVKTGQINAKNYTVRVMPFTELYAVHAEIGRPSVQELTDYFNPKKQLPAGIQAKIGRFLFNNGIRLTKRFRIRLNQAVQELQANLKQAQQLLNQNGMRNNVQITPVQILVDYNPEAPAGKPKFAFTLAWSIELPLR